MSRDQSTTSIPELSPTLEPKQRLELIIETMREMSTHSDPQEMVRAYGKRMRHLFPRDGMISVSRRDMQQPNFRITRASRWEEEIDPWKQKDRLPEFSGGIISELIYSDRPRIINDFEVDADDPAREFLEGYGSLMSVPLYDQGVALNMVVFLQIQPDYFSFDQLPELVWMSNLFGRATHNLVLSGQLQEAYQEVDSELERVAAIQRSLLPAGLPQIPSMQLAVYYKTSRRAGGDYYDFFPLGDDKWAIAIADVSGHGTPAAVLMAITHSLLHASDVPMNQPGKVLESLNRQLIRRYTADNGTFVTAFFAVYDAPTRKMRYASAGHHPPTIKQCCDQSIKGLRDVGGLPLGVVEDEQFKEAEYQFEVGDQVVFYTDGITESENPEGTPFGVQRLEAALGNCHDSAENIVAGVLGSLDEFTAGAAADDDRTLLVGRVT